MNFLKLGLLLVLTVVLQLAVFIALRIFGVAPELFALVAVLAGFLAGPERGATIAFAAGLMWDLWLPTPLGVAAMAFATVAFAIGSVEAGLFHENRLQLSALSFIGTMAAVIGYALLSELVGQRGFVDLELLRVSLIAGLLNSLLAPLAVRPVGWALRSPPVFREFVAVQ